ncbi:MAG: hypothetical protein IJ619_13070 [Eubacterium sp.]|nr:hypothetical protein [Eubacterium sp.]
MRTIKEFLIFLKDLLLEYLSSRLFPVTLVMLVMFAVIVIRLFNLQIVEGEGYADTLDVKTEKTISVDAIRGKIYDVNGNLLAYNQISYNLTFANSANLTQTARNMGITANELRNRIIHNTISILKQNKDSITLKFPVKLEGGKYEFTLTGTSLKNFLKDVYGKSSYDELTEEQKASTAEDVVCYLRFGNEKTQNFGITKEFTDEEAMEILACRYELWLNRYQQYVSVVIAEGISEKSKNCILEHTDTLLGMDIEVTSKRVYNDAKYFAHIIGYVGEASQADIERLNEQQQDRTYRNGDVVGKAGIEQVYETELHGTDGQEVVYVDNLGKVIETIDETTSIAGNDVYLTIDSDLQKYCYDILEQELATILASRIVDYAEVTGNNVSEAIPITDVYFSFFNNNLLSLEDMNKGSASDLEKTVYQTFMEGKSNAISEIRTDLLSEPVIISDQSSSRQDYDEYIFEMLKANEVYDPSLFDVEGDYFLRYSSGNITMQELLKYLIAIEAIDVSGVSENDAYYDADEAYSLLVDYIINKLKEDPDFDKCVIKSMLKEKIISGYDVVNLLYAQGVLSSDGDVEYQEFLNGAYSSFTFIIKKIQNLDLTPAMLALKPCSGSMVVTDVKTGKIKAMVSYPSYDNNKLTNSIDTEYYKKLLEDKTSPMYNRATMTRTAPGSTFKLISTIAGVSEGAIDLNTQITDYGVFEKGFSKPKCWVYRHNQATHGTIGIEKAIDISCNYFFYEVGYRLATKNGEYVDSTGMATIRKYAEMFGLGDKSGIEIEEISPNISDRDAVLSAIGQGTHSYTATQLSKYVTTIANSGTCYNLSLVDRTMDYTGNTVNEHEKSVYSTISLDPSLWNTVHTGMRLVVTDDLQTNTFLNHLSVQVAGKTGTAQEGVNNPAHALFISYAPYDNPEVSVTTVIQNGYNSANAAEVTGFVYAYMYDKQALAHATISGNNQVSD